MTSETTLLSTLNGLLITSLLRGFEKFPVLAKFRRSHINLSNNDIFTELVLYRSWFCLKGQMCQNARAQYHIYGYAYHKRYQGLPADR